MTSTPLLARATAPILAGALLAAAASASAQTLDQTEMMRFLVQATCADAAGRPIPASPFDAACVSRSAQTPDSPAGYRKHDWPSLGDRSQAPRGYQATDAVLSLPPMVEDDTLVVAQTFDFGGPSGGGFERFDAAAGDGGQVIALAQGSAAVFMTEDGGGGRQWFVGDGCQTGQRPAELSWLLFKDDVVSGDWRSDVARLSTTRSQDECPAAFGSAYTRYIRARVALPVLSEGQPSGTRTIDAVVSEHYDMPSIAQATHLERFYLGRDLGLVRWERWESAGGAPQAMQAAGQLAASGRCPSVAFSSAPAGGWVMVDCRLWTNIVPAASAWSVRRLGWSGVDTRARQAGPPAYGSGWRR